MGIPEVERPKVAKSGWRTLCVMKPIRSQLSGFRSCSIRARARAATHASCARCFVTYAGRGIDAGCCLRRQDRTHWAHDGRIHQRARNCDPAHQRRNTAGADVGPTNAGGLRADLAPGTVTCGARSSARSHFSTP